LWCTNVSDTYEYFPQLNVIKVDAKAPESQGRPNKSLVGSNQWHKGN
jgi:hypothetical protein